MKPTGAKLAGGPDHSPPAQTFLRNAFIESRGTVITVQTLLGHEKVDTTLGYARLYDGTVASDYYRAMSQVERLFELPDNRQVPVSSPAELVVLVDSLGNGMLNEIQREMLQVLRDGILSLVAREVVRV